jgi:uncharacterized membrane protein
MVESCISIMDTLSNFSSIEIVAIILFLASEWLGWDNKVRPNGIFGLIKELSGGGMKVVRKVVGENKPDDTQN